MKKLFEAKDILGIYGKVGISKVSVSENYVMSRKDHGEASVISTVFKPGIVESVNKALFYVEATSAEKVAILKRYG